MNRPAVTLTRHILESRSGESTATGEFSTIMAQIALAAKIIHRDVSLAGLIDVWGGTGEVNIQGEAVQKLDQKANETFVRVFEYYGGLVRTLVSEEMDKPLSVGSALPSGKSPGKYALFFDPLDGSSNTDVNGSLGSIFSVHRLEDQATESGAELLKTGSEQIAAGYVLYGPSTVLVYTYGAGVYQFTLDPGIGEFVLAAGPLRIPARGKVYSVNEGNYPKWPKGAQRFLDYLKEKDLASGRPYSSRYSGCLVADVHRLLTAGGVYLYPAEAEKAEGKLRLMYEAAPLALVVEQAGGKASTGAQRIAEIRPTTVHQRVPLIIGSPDDVQAAEDFLQGRR